MRTDDDLSPSRKDTILIMTVLGWAVCGVFSFVGYNMAREDLAMMDAGLMDDRDRSTVSLMKTLGLVQICLTAFVIVATCCLFAMVGTSPRYGY